MRRLAGVLVFAVALNACATDENLTRQATPSRSPALSPSLSPSAFASPSPSPSLVPPSPSPSPPPPPPKPKGPAFSGSISAIDRSRLPSSWREGCPVGVEDLRLLTVSFWGFDDKVHVGELVVHRDQSNKLLIAMEKIFDSHFLIERMELVDNFGADDDRSMNANNTSAFNCREVAGRPGVWSQHSFGRAIDFNPIQNPYVAGSGRVSPEAGGPYKDRSKKAPGMIHPGDPVVRAMSSVGWSWGGYWSSAKDYQHFSSNGR